MFKIKIITINIPIPYLDAIQALIECNKYPSRSEAIRIALRDFLMKESNFLEAINPIKIKREVMKDENSDC